MAKRISVKLLSLLLVAVMVVGLIPMYIFASGSVTNYEDFMTELKQLEIYAAEYGEQVFRDPVELILNFIRTGVERYQDSNWETLAGKEIIGFTNYVQTQDEENNTTVMNLRDIVTDNFRLPNGNQVDFGHMFGCMNISYINAGSSDLSGWAGDLCDLLFYCVDMASVPAGTVEEMTEYILDNCFGVDADNAFGWDDFYGDMDAYYLVTELKKGNSSLSELMEEYFTADLNNVDRAVYFMNNRFAVEDDADTVRKAIYDSYTADVGIKVLESKRGLTSYTALRQACCYAFADYLYSQAEGQLIAGNDPEDDDTNNGYYSVFADTETILAPGITQNIKYAQTVDGKQIVYYLATVEVDRDDVTIMANYKDNDPSKGWGMQRVEDQANALLKNYRDQYENFNVIVATNADGYNIYNGTPGGLLVMDGKEWHGVDKDGFFAILEDGRAMIGTQEDYATYKDQIREAVGGFGAVLVKDGKINVTKNANYTASRASRTAIGIKADGSVVMMVLDGRQQPFSAGGAMEEIAQIMYDAGCVDAINLDGGGSTTYLSKPAGSDKLQLVSRPSDGSARSVATSLVAISTAKPSNEFDKAILSSDYDYITTGTSMQIDVTGVSNTGNAAEIPANTDWMVSDETVGTIDENGIFTAVANGEVTIDFMVDGVSTGSKTLYVVEPDGITFAEERIVAIYETPTELLLTLWYEGKPVAFNPETDILIALQDANAGDIDGVVFTGSESSGIRTTMVGAMVLSNDELVAYATINLYKADEALFDFDNATQGNRSLAWVREVSNTHTLDDQVYRIIDPDAPIEIDYTFALDMTAIEMPAQLEPLKSMLPDGTNPNANAWSFMLSLAERICTQTYVKITAEFSKDLDVDLSGLKVVTDYFEPTTINLDENNCLTLICNWKDQTQAINPATANPLCILSGIKATVKDTASFYNNELVISNNGNVSYDIYMATSALHSFASDPENQALYGLAPYEHDPGCRIGDHDKGGHFASQYVDFADIYVVSSQILQGWIEDSYYVNNVPVTGLQYVPDRHDAAQKRFCYFDDDGILLDEVDITGLIEYEDNLYYAVLGVAQTGWQQIDNNNYYFHPDTGRAVDGVYTIRESANSWQTNEYTYTFENHILVKGDMVYETQAGESGYRYRWAGDWKKGAWFEFEGKTYHVTKNIPYFVTTGYATYILAEDGVTRKCYLFDETTGALLEDFTGIKDVVENGKQCTYYFVNGVRSSTVGLVEDSGYYYFVQGNANIYKNKTSVYVNSNQAHGFVPAGTYDFDEYGRLVGAFLDVETVGVEVEYDVLCRAVTVAAEEACRVGYLDENGKYVALKAKDNGDGTHNFAAPKDVSEVVIVLAGDADGDGAVTADDKALLNEMLLGNEEMTAEAVLAMDMNGDGQIKNSDKTRLHAIMRGKLAMEW